VSKDPNRFRQSLIAWLLILPALSFLAVFTYLPVLRTVWDSVFSEATPMRPARFVGLDNYRDILANPVFMTSAWNNLIYAVVTIPVAVGLALVMALWANQKLRGTWFLRLSFFLPTVLPMIAVANIWLFFFTPQYGLFDQFTGLFGIEERNWLGMPQTALACVMIVTVWKEAGFFMIFYLGALQQIPPDLISAARLEGASRWKIFTRVTWPLLMPTTIFVVINATINAFRIIDHVIVMTKGGPGHATSLLLFHLYESAFKFWELPYAAALTAFLLAGLAGLAAIQFFLLERKAHYR
jgi:sn-glycerol 3-phosphate transport system permease protein